MAPKAGSASVSPFSPLWFLSVEQDTHHPLFLTYDGVVHGLGATNQFFYDVYTRISELDLREIGLTTQWHTLAPKIKEEEWHGVKQKYWQLERYYCPIAQLDVFD